MARKLRFRTRSFGSESRTPDLNELTQWVSGRRGTEGDITTYHLESSLLPQLDAGIDLPCAGGLFFGSRLKESLEGVIEETITGELDYIPDILVADAIDILEMHRDTWFALPAPHYLGIRDKYYGDAEEASQAIITAYKPAMRAMRDAGIRGHVLICSHINPAELESLSGKRVFFFQKDSTAEDLAFLLEYQKQIAIECAQIHLLIDLMEEFVVSGLVILHPEPAALLEAMKHWDPDKIFTGGYCEQECEKFWGSLAGASDLII